MAEGAKFEPLIPVKSNGAFLDSPDRLQPLLLRENQVRPSREGPKVRIPLAPPASQTTITLSRLILEGALPPRRTSTPAALSVYLPVLGRQRLALGRQVEQPRCRRDAERRLFHQVSPTPQAGAAIARPPYKHNEPSRSRAPGSHDRALIAIIDTPIECGRRRPADAPAHDFGRYLATYPCHATKAPRGVQP